MALPSPELILEDDEPLDLFIPQIILEWVIRSEQFGEDSTTSQQPEEFQPSQSNIKKVYQDSVIFTDAKPIITVLDEVESVVENVEEPRDLQQPVQKKEMSAYLEMAEAIAERIAMLESADYNQQLKADAQVSYFLGRDKNRFR